MPAKAEAQKTVTATMVAELEVSYNDSVIADAFVDNEPIVTTVTCRGFDAAWQMSKGLARRGKMPVKTKLLKFVRKEG